MEIGELTEKEKEIIKLRYGLREPTEEEWQRIVNGHPNAPGGRTSVPEYRSFLNCLDTGYVLNFCESRICQLELKALQKMKRALKRMDSPNRRILSYPSDGLYERGCVEPEVNNQYLPPAPEKPKEEAMLPTIEAIAKNRVRQKNPAHTQRGFDDSYMVRIEGKGDSYFRTQEEAGNYIKGLFSNVGVSVDRIHVYRKLDLIFSLIE